MILRIAKWGNSLAVRIPVEYVRHAGLNEGDTVHASLTVDGALATSEAGSRKSATIAEVARDVDHAGSQAERAEKAKAADSLSRNQRLSEYGCGDRI
jgi:antitoxin MazE